MVFFFSDHKVSTIKKQFQGQGRLTSASLSAMLITCNALENKRVTCFD